MKFVYSPLYKADIGFHVFPTEKYDFILQRLRAEGLVDDGDMVAPQRPSDEQLRKIVTAEYLDDLLNYRMTERTYPSEMPVNKDIIDAQILCCGGSFLAAQIAFEHGMCYHIGGGFHHAFADHAEGFCYLNDVVFSAVMMLEHRVEKIAVIDCDLHQGNGTAKFFENEHRVFTFSIHQEHLYPVKQKSDLDIGLRGGAGDDEYLKELKGAVDHIFDKFNPQLVIYVAGADPYVFDQLGNLQLTVEGLKRRDELVLQRARDKAVPVATVLAGGYAENVEDTVEIHCNTARVMHGCS
ncbi:MAG: histone deacetylase [candidate division WOR-3 bacterium]|nr:MAG: histone deacetylase [candidate division WOR-3 bacterium]